MIATGTANDESFTYDSIGNRQTHTLGGCPAACPQHLSAFRHTEFFSQLTPRQFPCYLAFIESALSFRIPVTPGFISKSISSFAHHLATPHPGQSFLSVRLFRFSNLRTALHRRR